LIPEKIGVGRTAETTDRAGDEARAEIELPLTPAELRTFLKDTGLVLRLNPHLEIEQWQSLPDGFRFAVVNELNGCRLATAVRLDDTTAARVLEYAEGLKQATRFAIEPAAGGARLVVTEHYPRIDDPNDPRVAEVDRSLVPWMAALRRHLLARRRWAWVPGWRWWNERFLPGMPPRQRRIVRLIIWVSLAEFMIFLGLVIVLRYAA
jgi:hypothetical protein